MKIFSMILIALIIFSMFAVSGPKALGGRPAISLISPIVATNLQTINIYGSGFGNIWPQTVPVGDGSVDTVCGDARSSGLTPWMVIVDTGNYQKTGNSSDGANNWSAGVTNLQDNCNAIGIYITNWTDTQIILGGFGSALGTNATETWYIEAGDPLAITIVVPGGQTTYHITVSATNPSPLFVSCSPNPATAGSPVKCNAFVFGSNPTGTVNWSTSSITGSFNESVCTLSSAGCSTTYTDSNAGSVNITANYSGDLNNEPCNSSIILILNPIVNPYFNADEMIGATTRLDQPINQLLDPPSNVGACINLLANVYETLITFSPDRVDTYVPVLAASWNTTDDGLTYTFTIRQGVKFHNGDIMTTADVEYSMKRILVMDNIYWSGYLMYDALFGLSGSRDGNGNIIVTAEQLDNKVSSTETTVTFHLLRPYQPFLQILSLPCMSIMNKKWCIVNGEWPGAWNNWTYYNRRSSLIDRQIIGPPGPHVNAMCGTGPYMFDYFIPGVEYSMVKFNDYWRGWPCAGLNSSFSRVTVKQISDWSATREEFLTGQLDFVKAPATATNELLGKPGVQCAYPLPTLECDAIAFNFNISTSSPFLGVPNGLPYGTFDESGIPPDLFSDINVRKGFAYAFNYTQFMEEAFLGDALQPATPIIAGLPFYNVDQEKYTQNLTKSRELLESAWNGQLWADGMNMTVCYCSAWNQKACENLKSNVENLNPKFHIQIDPIDLGPCVNYWYAGQMPIVLVGWTADFADPQNFAPSFMDYNFGFWAHFQNFDNSTYENLVRQGISTTNITERQDIYYQLQNLYWQDCVGVPVAQPVGHVFMRDWIHGWSFNQVLGWFDGGLHRFYQEWKEPVLPYQLQIGENMVNITGSTAMVVMLNTTVPGNLTVTNFDICLEGTAEQGTNVSAMNCVGIETAIPHENITFPIQFRIYYTDQQVISAYVNQSSLHMFTRNGTSWIEENDSGVVTTSDILGFSGYVWANIWHLSEFSAMGQKTLIHSVVPKDVRPCKTIVGRGYNSTIYSDIFNQGDYVETFSLALYANSTFINAKDNVSLQARNSGTISIIWNNTDFEIGNYTFTCTANYNSGELGILESNCTSIYIVHIGIPGDISGPTQGVYDGTCNMRDVQYLILRFNTNPSSSNWNPNADVNDDGTVNMRDIQIAILNFNKHE